MIDYSCTELQRRLDRARGALKVIHTWASFRGGQHHLTPADVRALCRRVLDDTEPRRA